MAFDEESFPPEHPYSRVPVSPGGIRLPPMWLLGSSGASASAAGQLGIGYAFAAHFSHTPPAPAFEAYRYAFRPTEAFPKPQTMLCVSVICAPTDEEAQYLSRSQAVSWALFTTGEQRKLMSPEEAHARVLTSQQQGVIDHQSTLWIVGSPATVRDAIAEKAESCGAGEVMITTTIHSYALRRRSYALVAEAFGLELRAL
ncbi:MAG: hypothetical protein B7Z15_22985 [Rhizobiales bacterium 32-66-8]|nr:MAG: hypothetical protein B7Z15_22985 [Rhizobiales bacterium 32-66-8]